MHLRSVRPECDLPANPDDDVEVRLGRGLKHPKDNGYAAFFRTLGCDRHWAGMLAARIVEEGRVRAATSKRSTEFRNTLRRLSDPRRDPKAFVDDAKVALENLEQTELADGLFNELPLFHSLVFIFGLRQCIAGDMSLRSEVVGIAGAVWRRTPVSRGRKLTHASAAHEYFLESQIFDEASFTWSPIEEDFTDRFTLATREEFEEPAFNPRPAWRRLRAKLGSASRRREHVSGP